MIIAIVDTETISLDKPFIYNIGYCIVDTDNLNDTPLIKKDFIVQQAWENKPLFNTAYYSDKKLVYISAMKGRRAKMNKYGYICREMIRDFETLEVQKAFAYCSDFDEKAFNYNCEWYKCSNPFDNIPFSDIRAFFQEFCCDDNFKNFCENNGEFTDSGNYSTTAQTAYRFITNNNSFIEEHTALSDCLIEWTILKECFKKGASPEQDLKAKRSIPRKVNKILTVKRNKDIIFSAECSQITYRKNNNTIYLKD